MKWTRDDVEFLEDNWLVMSGADISQAIDGRHSRSAVIGRANRMKLKPKAVVNRYKNASRRPRRNGHVSP